MFLTLAALLGLALWVIGGTPDYATLLLEFLCLTATIGLLIHRIFKKRALDVRILTLWVFCLFAAIIDAKLTLSVFACGWAAIAARESPKKVFRFFGFLLVIGSLEALLGLIQHFVAPGWMPYRQNPYYPVSGTLINKNHFAGLLELLIPVALGFAYTAALRTRDTARTLFHVLVGAFMALALIFSFSRMGIFAFALTLLLLGAALRIKFGGGMASRPILALVAIVLAGTVWIGTGEIARRYGDLMGADALVQEGRIIVFRDTVRMIAENPWGVGPGNYENFFRSYQTFRPDLALEHAHNDYLESAAEWGIVPALVVWAVIFAAVIRIFRGFLASESMTRSGVLLTCLGATFSILIHGLADFNLQIPSNAMLFFAFLGIGVVYSGSPQDSMR